MSRASDILRERAEHAAYNGRAHDAAVIAAVAELMEAGRERIIVQGSYRGSEEAEMLDAEKCLICGCIDYCVDDCALAALERAIGESDASK